MEWPHTLKLSKPYRLGNAEDGLTVSEIVFGEPTFGAFFGLKTDPSEWTLGDYAEAAATLSGHPRSLFAKLSIPDGRAAMSVVDRAMAYGMLEDPDEPGKP